MGSGQWFQICCLIFTLWIALGSSTAIRTRKGSVIRIIRANYGRFANHKCNEKGMDWFNRRCMYHGTTDIMKDRCGSRKLCSVLASNDVFEDSCPDVLKYLEVGWNCTEPEPTTRRPTTLDQNVENTTKLSVAQDKDPATKTPQSNTKPQPTSANKPTPASPTLFSGRTMKPVQEPVKPVRYCPATRVRSVYWPATEVGHFANQPCPNRQTEAAEWFCSLEGEWYPKTPDLSRCVFQWAQTLRNAAYRADTLQNVLDVMEMTKSEARTSALYGGDISEVAGILADLADRTHELSQGASSAEKTHTARELSQDLVETAGFLLRGASKDAWEDLGAAQQQRAALALLDSLETGAQLLATTVTHTTTRETPGILMEVTVGEIKDYVQAPSRSFYDTAVDSIQVPKEAFIKDGQKEMAKMIFVQYSHIGEYLKPKPLIRKTRSGDRLEVQRTVASKVITAAVNSDNPVRGLASPIVMTLSTQQSENYCNPVCVWWDKKAVGSGFSAGSWSQAGCTLRAANRTHTVCECDHMTTFAVLMDVDRLRPDEFHTVLLTFITYAGCVISIICLFVSILVFLIMMGHKGMHNERLTIHLNLCICLLLAELLFVCGIMQVWNRVLCGVVAGCLQYFFLAAFAWMLLEGFQLYVMLVEVFESQHSKEKWLYLFGYGMPAVIVGISVGIDYRSYGTEHYCWLRSDNYFVLTFVIPVAVVLVANAICLVMALTVLCRHSNISIGYRCCQRRYISEHIGMWLRAAVILVVVLGLTWGFGLLYISRGTLLFNCLFTVLNSLQGFFIFLFYVVLNEKVRQAYRKWRHKTEWLPACFKDPAMAPSPDYYCVKRPAVDDATLQQTHRTSYSSRASMSSHLPPSSTESNYHTQSYLTKYLGSDMTRMDFPLYTNADQSINQSESNNGKHCYACPDFPENRTVVFSFNMDDVNSSSPPVFPLILNEHPRLYRPPPNFPPPTPPDSAQRICIIQGSPNSLAGNGSSDEDKGDYANFERPLLKKL